MANVTTSGKASHLKGGYRVNRENVGGNQPAFEPDNRATRRKHATRAAKVPIVGTPLKRWGGMHASRMYRI